MEFSPFQLNYACFYEKDDPSTSLFIAWALNKKPGFSWYAAQVSGEADPTPKLMSWQDGDERYVFLCDILAPINDLEVMFLTLYQQAERDNWLNPATPDAITPLEYKVNYFVRYLRDKEGVSLKESLALCRSVLSKTKIPHLKFLHDQWLLKDS